LMVYSPLEGGKLCRTHDPDQSPVKSQQSAPARSSASTKSLANITASLPALVASSVLRLERLTVHVSWIVTFFLFFLMRRCTTHSLTTPRAAAPPPSCRVTPGPTEDAVSKRGKGCPRTFTTGCVAVRLRFVPTHKLRPCRSPQMRYLRVLVLFDTFLHPIPPAPATPGRPAHSVTALHAAPPCVPLLPLRSPQLRPT
jgi:hypothetical protein